VYSYDFFEKAVECDFWSVFLKAQVATGSRTRLTNERCCLRLYSDCYGLPCGATTRRRAVNGQSRAASRDVSEKCFLNYKTLKQCNIKCWNSKSWFCRRKCLEAIVFGAEAEFSKFRASFGMQNQRSSRRSARLSILLRKTVAKFEGENVTIFRYFQKIVQIL